MASAGTPIVFWRIDQETSEDCDEEESEHGRRRILLRYYTVFNVDQCEGIDVGLEALLLREVALDEDDDRESQEAQKCQNEVRYRAGQRGLTCA